MLSEQYGNKLAVIYVESQGLSGDEAEAYAYGKRWMGRDVVWTTERPFDTGSRGLPNFALLSNEGKVLLKGNPLSRKWEIVGAIDQEIARAKKGPQGTPKSLRKAWADFEKGKYAAALKAVQKVAGYGRKDAAAAERILAIFEGRILSKIRRAGWMIENGYYRRAGEMTASLAKGIRGLDQHEAALKELKKKLASPDLKTEIAAARAFEKIEKKAFSDGLGRKVVEQLEKLVEEKMETKAAERARHLINVAGGS
jgi:hypothetical protein